MDPETVAIAGIALIPLIIALIQVLKMFLPRVQGNIWLGVSMGLGIVGQVVVYRIENQPPRDLASWAAVVVLGLAFGLAASKTYDESIDRI